ncbi:glycosyltransferase family 4 protein [Brachybacterium saurashtrense]|uniref:Glycosyltransferase n=1 Tax=Brachybacterium saurashtrense TaxID=556288 RepID=A0A345YSF6_9MICO|nr:glycosyltransferase family 4 protein [Brachybacterium saurashtrense]AXK46858.1 glycosyltransferase [Brachybacterium saurashtrense]RRR22573.1 glycosyltransferase [Brachybacterium saurashtrense]
MSAADVRPRFVLAANQGELGGGEVMLLATAQVLQRFGLDVSVIAPARPALVVEAAAARGLPTIPLPGATRRGYLAALARWRLRHPAVPLWCHGLAPALATAGIGPRLVHLHQLPRRWHRRAAALASWRAARVLVPSHHVAARVPGAEVLENWTAEVPFAPSRRAPGTPFTVGFLGRLTRDKGVDVLARAMAHVAAEHEVRLLLAGETRFGRPDEAAALEAALRDVEGITERPGWMARDAFFAAVDLAVFPSSAPESFGLVAAEAMAAGVPFVISDAGALPEVAGPDHPWVARHGEAEDLARVLARALEELRQGDEQRAHRARERWQREYSPQAGEARVARMLSGLAAPAHGERRGDR